MNITKEKVRIGTPTFDASISIDVNYRKTAVEFAKLYVRCGRVKPEDMKGEFVQAVIWKNLQEGYRFTFRNSRKNLDFTWMGHSHNLIDGRLKEITEKATEAFINAVVFHAGLNTGDLDPIATAAFEKVAAETVAIFVNENQTAEK